MPHPESLVYHFPCSWSARDVLVSRHNENWTLVIRLGGAGSRWLPVRSRGEALRTWASFTGVGRFT
nr:hypothetical protein [Pseudomonas syringae]